MQNDLLLFALVAGIAAVLATVLILWRARRRSAALREHFGPEYDLAVERHGNRARAERELAARDKRHHELHIQLLSDEQCDRFGAAWSDLQLRFVDDPGGAVSGADALVQEVMTARGYPMTDFEQRVADLSVEHAAVVRHYRAACAIANAKGEAGTEELRKAMVYYRALFTDLLQTERASSELHVAHA
jgi:hypothetical protein